jgi:hypothetical protein
MLALSRNSLVPNRTAQYIFQRVSTNGFNDLSYHLERIVVSCTSPFNLRCEDNNLGEVILQPLRDSVTRFFTSGFFLQTTSPGPSRQA